MGDANGITEVLNVSLSTIKRLIASGQLRVSSPVGMRRVLIRGQHILELLEQSLVDPEAPAKKNKSDS